MTCKVCNKPISLHKADEIMICMSDAGFADLSYAWKDALHFGLENDIIREYGSDAGMSLLLLRGKRKPVTTSEPTRVVYSHYLSKMYEPQTQDTEREDPLDIV